MTGSARSEIYFIVAMMVVILAICGTAVYYFFKIYKKEMLEREVMRSSKKVDTAVENSVE